METQTPSSGTASGVVVVKAKPVRKVFKGVTRTINKLPQEILNDPEINEAISALPQNYNFEIHKTIWRCREMNAKRVALQLPEGLLMFSLIISDIIERFTEADTVIMGDVSRGELQWGDSDFTIFPFHSRSLTGHVASTISPQRL